MEMNSTEAETIIGMLIDGANKGNIDLSDFCNVISSITKEKIIQGMAKITTEMEEATQGLCNTTQQLCTMCACQYKNDAVYLTVNSMNEAIINAIEEASLLCADKPDVQEDITDQMKLVPEGVEGRVAYKGLASSVIDQLIVTSPESVWNIHDTHDHDDEEEHDHEHEHEDREITAMLIKFKSPMNIIQFPRQINENTNLQAAVPSYEISSLFKLFGFEPVLSTITLMDGLNDMLLLMSSALTIKECSVLSGNKTVFQ